MSERQRILVVDDDIHNVGLIRELCEHLGYQVETAADGVEALEAVGFHRPDLVLLDLNMPTADGFEVLATLKADPATRELPVVIVTATSDLDAKVRGIELGAEDFLTKPFKLFELKARVRAALQVRHYQDRLRAAEEALARHEGEDPVTGAGAFAQLHAHLDYEVTRARRYGRPLTALLVAVDDYFPLREKLGGEAGDRVLAEVVSVIRDATRQVDRVFRMEVEEFVVLLPETPLEGAVVVAERIREAVGDLAPAGDVSCCIGAAAFPHSEIRGGEDLLKAANEALKAARRSGTGRIAQHTA
jgi:two-component system, cell cycle response regulator